MIQKYKFIWKKRAQGYYYLLKIKTPATQSATGVFETGKLFIL